MPSALRALMSDEWVPDPDGSGLVRRSALPLPAAVADSAVSQKADLLKQLDALEAAHPSSTSPTKHGEVTKQESASTEVDTT